MAFVAVIPHRQSFASCSAVGLVGDEFGSVASECQYTALSSHCCGGHGISLRREPPRA